jgi:vacuolar-type H+-ATPase subunit I/STV1
MSSALVAGTATLPPVGRRSRLFRLRRKARKVALTAHILSSVGWFGIAVVVAFCAVTAAATTDRTLPPALYRVMETAPWLSIPVGLIAVSSGAILGLGTSVGLVWHWWVVQKLVIATAVIVTDAVLVGRLAHDAVLAGDGEPSLIGSTVAHVVVLTIATVLSVFKPGGRTPWSLRRSNQTLLPASERHPG